AFVRRWHDHHAGVREQCVADSLVDVPQRADVWMRGHGNRCGPRQYQCGRGPAAGEVLFEVLEERVAALVAIDSAEIEGEVLRQVERVECLTTARERRGIETG